MAIYILRYHRQSRKENLLLEVPCLPRQNIKAISSVAVEILVRHSYFASTLLENLGVNGNSQQLGRAQQACSNCGEFSLLEPEVRWESVPGGRIPRRSFVPKASPSADSWVTGSRFFACGRQPMHND